MQNTGSTTSMVRMLLPSMPTCYVRSASLVVRTPVQPILVFGYQRPPATDRSTSRASKQQQPRPQQQPSKTAAPPRAYQTPSSNSRRNQQDMFEAAKGAADKFVCRHDPFTVGFGCLLVTGYCVVAHGQDVGEALRLAGFSTILGMVMQELLVNSR